MTDARERLYWMVTGYRAAQLIRTAALLGVCDVLAAGPLGATDVAAQVGTDPGMVRRLLRSLTGLGVLEEREDGAFSNAEMGELLRKDVLGSVRHAAIMFPDDHWWAAWSALPRALKENRMPFDVAHGRSFWDVAAADRELAANFNGFMVELTAAFVPQLLGAFDFSGCRLVVDVGGGNGGLLGGVLGAHPSVKGIVFDLEAGLQGADHQLSRLGVRDRCDLVGGNFFESIPNGGDAYLLRQILHDWDDDRASQILTVCRRAMSPGARLLVIDCLLPARATDSPADRYALILDMHMHVLFGARERTEDELRAMAESCGFKVERVIPASPQSIIVATAV